jgi:Chromo shadow domain
MAGLELAWMSPATLTQDDFVHRGDNLVNFFDGLSLEAGTSNCSSNRAIGLDPQLEEIVAVTVRDGDLFVGVKWEGSWTVEFVNVKSISQKWPIKLLKYYESHLVFLEKQDSTCRPLEQTDIDAFVAVMRPNTIQKFGKPTEILDIVISNQIMFIVVRWVEENTLGCIPAHIVHRKFPNMLISFYEARFIWM